ncbi:hypothetical protein G9274_001952 [Stenotrophomonas rhizophila]|nr:hypothetical protein G9274_001952 [Stenotrophomonas rhizophila]
MVGLLWAISPARMARESGAQESPRSGAMDFREGVAPFTFPICRLQRTAHLFALVFPRWQRISGGYA